MEVTNNIPESVTTYLLANHKTKSAAEMAKELKRGNKTIYEWLAALGLEPKAKDFSHGRSHPFRRQNRKLETLFLGRKIENSQRKIKRA